MALSNLEKIQLSKQVFYQTGISVSLRLVLRSFDWFFISKLYWPASYLLRMILQREGGRGTSRTRTTEEAVVAWAGVDQKYCHILIALFILINCTITCILDIFSSYTINHFYVTFQMNLSQLQIYIYWDGTGSLSTGELSWLFSSHYWTASSMSGLANIGVWSIQL